MGRKTKLTRFTKSSKWTGGGPFDNGRCQRGQNVETGKSVFACGDFVRRRPSSLGAVDIVTMPDIRRIIFLQACESYSDVEIVSECVFRGSNFDSWLCVR